MTSEQISEVIRTHIVETSSPEKRDLEFTDTSSLVATGILDSVGVFSLVAFLEQRYGIDVSESDLAWKTFETVESIAHFVESKLAALDWT